MSVLAPSDSIMVGERDWLLDMPFSSESFWRWSEGVPLECPWSPLPGRVAVQMYEPRETATGIALPSSGRMNPDCGTVLASAVSWLKPGDAVLVRKYTGAVLEPRETGRDSRVRIFGVCEDSHMALPAKVGAYGRLLPTPGWSLVTRDARPGSSTVLSPEDHYLPQGVDEHGCRVAFDPTGPASDHHCKPLLFGLNTPDPSLCLAYDAFTF